MQHYLQMNIFAKCDVHGNKIIHLSQRFIILTDRDQYMVECDDFMQWFSDIAEKTENMGEGVLLTDLKDIFQYSSSRV